MKTHKWKTILFLCAAITACDPEGEDPSWSAADPVENGRIEDELDAIDHERIEEEAVTEDVTKKAEEFSFPIYVCGFECPAGYYKSGSQCSFDCPYWTAIDCENQSVCHKIP